MRPVESISGHAGNIWGGQLASTGSGFVAVHHKDQPQRRIANLREILIAVGTICSSGQGKRSGGTKSFVGDCAIGELVTDNILKEFSSLV
jgi:hypothetical protein